MVDEVVVDEVVVDEVVVTKEEIEQHYSAMMDSVKLLEDGIPENFTDEDWVDTVSRNKEHIKLMLSKDFWTTESMTRANTVIK